MVYINSALDFILLVTEYGKDHKRFIMLHWPVIRCMDFPEV